MTRVILIFFFSISVFAQQRIVALSPAVNEIVFALGSGDKIVGNTKYCNYPQRSKYVQKVGGYFKPSLEMILSLKPDLVIMQQNNYKLNEQLKKLKITTLVIHIDNLLSIKNSILDIGSVLEKKIQAQDIVNSIDKEIKKLKNIIKNKKILIVFGRNLTLSSKIFVAGNNLYFDDIINKSSNINALQSDRKGQPILGMENIIATDPDIVILLTYSLNKNNIKKSELIKPWKKLPIKASLTNSIYILDKVSDGIPSDRIIDFLKDFRKILDNYKTEVQR